MTEEKKTLKPATGHKICGWKLAGQFADQKQIMLDQNLWLSINLYQSIQICAVQRVNHSRPEKGSHPADAVTEAPGAPAPPRQRATAARAALKMKLPLVFCSSCAGDRLADESWRFFKGFFFSTEGYVHGKKNKNKKHPNLGMGQNLLWLSFTIMNYMTGGTNNIKQPFFSS